MVVKRSFSRFLLVSSFPTAFIARCGARRTEQVACDLGASCTWPSYTMPNRWSCCLCGCWATTHYQSCDSREIFVLCSTVADAHRLSEYSVDVSGDYVIFKMVHRLNLIGSPYDLNYLNKTKPIRWHWDFVCFGYCLLSYISSTSSSNSSSSGSSNSSSSSTMTGFDLWDSTKSCSVCVELM